MDEWRLEPLGGRLVGLAGIGSFTLIRFYFTGVSFSSGLPLGFFSWHQFRFGIAWISMQHTYTCSLKQTDQYRRLSDFLVQ